ncbi:MAG: hypothetical protein KAH01_05945 [Caldisericia bacterium]|nr:hypothetical protein [Caldisericia bacterium]
MFYNYLSIFILSLPILGLTVFGFYLISIKKPFLRSTKEKTIHIAALIIAVITFLTFLKSDNAGLSTILGIYTAISLYGISIFFDKGNKFMLFGVDEKINLIFVYLLKTHKIVCHEKPGIVVVDTNTKINLNYFENRNTCSIVINGENNNVLIKETLHEIVEFYSKKQSKAYKKTAFIFIWSGIIFYIALVMLGMWMIYL